MIQADLLIRVLDALEKNNIEYMVTGSFASNIYSMPRSTLDADIIINGTKTNIEKLVGEFQEDFYADVEVALDALRRRSMFNIIHLTSGFKIDLIFLKFLPFSEQEFIRERSWSSISGKSVGLFHLKIAFIQSYSGRKSANRSDNSTMLQTL